MIETYIPLYRKYRPQAFGDLVGQEVVSTAIGNALSLGKIAHAYLFCGPRGTGKTSSARIFAKSLNCEQGPTLTPCQTCASCQAITAGTALDVTEIDAASNNSVNDIRDLTDKVAFSAIQGKYKIYIIDEVHMLSAAAFNALLKTLEEPPPNVVFVFATTEPHRVLPTIVSRCQRFDFSRITREQIEGRLTYVAQQEGIAITPEAITLIARHVRGGMRDALGLLDQVSVLGRSGDKTIDVADVRAFIGVLEEDLLLDLTQGIQTKDPQVLLGQLQTLQERGVEPPQVVKDLTHHMRNLLIARTAGPQASPDTFDLAPEYYRRLCEQAVGFAPEELPQMLNRLSLLESQLRHSQQPQLWLEVALLDLCYRQDILVVKALAERVDRLEAMLSGGAPVPVAQTPVRPATPQAPPQRTPASQPQPVQSALPTSQTSPVTVPTPPVFQPQPAAPATSGAGAAPGGDLNVAWQRVLDAITSPTTKALASQHFRLTAQNGNTLTIGAKDTIYETFKRSTAKLEQLQQAVDQVFGPGFHLKFDVLSQLPPMAAPIVGGQSPAAAPRQPVAPQPETPAVSATPVSSLAGETPDLSQMPPRFDAPPAEEAIVAQPEPIAAVPKGAAEAALDLEMAQAKQYTQDLLQAKVID